ncbi:hypothetical protein VP01_1602g2 [Puccinia sorghi]|uniref:Palmitoyltransferase n=1 Tax=Puccinia sorghi TaxID=27349 RepID=A0A0L6VJ52_9BASI|nr:hypothetical protein VP01_1602g2 [Puccinia sorghi]
MNHFFNRSYKKLEQLIPQLGKLFITIAVTLITIALITYFNVIYPTTLNTPLSFLISIYLTINTTTHYYWATTINPGSPSTHQPKLTQHHQLKRYCKKCINPTIKPERAHHCRHCGRCQLKYDHHKKQLTNTLTQGINQCVGLRNERFFLLFLFYMSISCAWIVYWGWPCFTKTLDFTTPWPFWSPRIFMILTWILALAIGVAITIMFACQLWLVAKGETTVESSDNGTYTCLSLSTLYIHLLKILYYLAEYYRILFSQRGQKYVNPYDLGVRKNLQEFFNIGPLPGRWPWYSILIPLKIPPVSDGWTWNKRPAHPDARELSFAEELTDEED